MEETTVAKPAKKPPNPDAGEVLCPFCKTDQPVRKNIKGKLYINCSNDGVVQPSLPHFQEWILENAKLYGAEKPDRPAPRPTPVKTPEPDLKDAPRAEPVAAVAPAKPASPPPQPSSAFRLFK